MILEDYLKQDAELYPNKTAIICGDKSLTFCELWNAVCKTAETLPKGEIVVFRASQDIDFMVKYLALHINSSVAVPVEKDLPENSFNEIIEFLKR